MNTTRKLNIVDMIFGLAVIAVQLAGLYYLIQQPVLHPNSPFTVDDLKYYTVLTALITVIAGFLMIWSNIVSIIRGKDSTPRLFYSLRFLSATMSFVTLLTVIIFLRPYFLDPNQGPKDFNLPGPFDCLFGMQGGCLFLHLVGPILSIFEFISFEIEPRAKFKKTFEPFIATILYSIAMIIVIFTKIELQGVDKAKEWSPYFFFWIIPSLDKDWAYNIGIAFATLAVAYADSFTVWLVNRITHTIYIGEEYRVAPINTRPNIPTPKAPAYTNKKGKVKNVIIVEEAKGVEKSKVSASNKKAAVATTATVATISAKKANPFAKYMKSKFSFGNKDEIVTGATIYHVSYHDRRLHTWKVKAENSNRALKVFPTQKEAIAFAAQQVKKSGGSVRVHSMSGGFRKGNKK